MSSTRAGAASAPPSGSPEAAPGGAHAAGDEHRSPEGHDASRAPADPAADPAADPVTALGARGPEATHRVVDVMSRPRPSGASAFALGFVGALGVLLAIALVQAVVQAGQIVTLVFASLFLALSLDPFVTFLERHRLPRPAAVAVTFVLLLGAVGGFIAAVAPLVVEEGSQLIRVSPFYARRIEQSQVAQSLDAQFGLFERINTELENRLRSSTTIDALFGGVLGAGRAVITGVFSVLLVLVLTLYFLASLRSVTAGVYRLVPLSRRERVQRIGEEAQRRVGGYVLGQLGVASLNGLLAFVVMTVLDVRYSVALAFAVGVFGLIPLIGATIGAVLACTVAALGDLSDGIVLAVWFLVYQQVENYVILPRIMARTVAVPSTLAVVAALVGGSLLGLIGALVAIPLAATILLVVKEVVYPRQESR
ncbi:AI-2E family transporter [Aquipuribacter nitratireducens]|uniref:AI-2E family transporter n=1 Tax=Aquipuribacter nitratireducens TaxID=650104 RepID=A0ABW0GNZ8_9MICO